LFEQHPPSKLTQLAKVEFGNDSSYVNYPFEFMEHEYHSADNEYDSDGDGDSDSKSKRSGSGKSKRRKVVKKILDNAGSPYVWTAVAATVGIASAALAVCSNYSTSFISSTTYVVTDGLLNTSATATITATNNNTPTEVALSRTVARPAVLNSTFWLQTLMLVAIPSLLPLQTHQALVQLIPSFILITKPNWTGVETITYEISDSVSSASNTIQLTVPTLLQSQLLIHTLLTGLYLLHQLHCSQP